MVGCLDELTRPSRRDEAESTYTNVYLSQSQRLDPARGGVPWRDGYSADAAYTVSAVQDVYTAVTAVYLADLGLPASVILVLIDLVLGLRPRTQSISLI